MPRVRVRIKNGGFLRKAMEDSEARMKASLRRALAESLVTSPDENDDVELTDAELQTMRPVADVWPPSLLAAHEKQRRARGPQKTPTKQAISIRLDRDVLDAFKSTGPGWQGRMGETLKKHAPKQTVSSRQRGSTRKSATR